MMQPPGFVHPQFPQHICKLKMALYDLKQAPKAWYEESSFFLLDTSFTNTIRCFSFYLQQEWFYCLYARVRG